MTIKREKKSGKFFLYEEKWEVFFIERGGRSFIWFLNNRIRKEKWI